MKLGIYLCSCNNTIDIDFKKLKRCYQKDVDAFVVHDRLCQSGLDYIAGDVKRWKLDTAIIGCTAKNDIFEGIFDGNILFLNLREQCGWVHEKREATEKAKSMIKRVMRSIDSEIYTEEYDVDVGDEVLVLGDYGALDIANSLSEISNVTLILSDIDPESVMEAHEIKIDLGRVKEVYGNIGDFKVEIECDIDAEKCISCGLCVEECPLDAIKQNIVYKIDESCDRCERCIKVCPTGAIDFNGTKMISTGQILVMDDRWDHTTQFGVYIAGEEDASPEVLSLALNIGKTRKSKFLDVDLELCASGDSGYSGCNLCLACPYDAVSLKDGHVSFNEVACNGCGFCTSICPLTLPKLREYPQELLYSQMDDLLDADLRPKVILFTSYDEGLMMLDFIGRRKVQYPPVLPIFVPSIGFVSEAHILKAFDLGADGVVLLGQKNENIGDTVVNTVVSFSETVLENFGLGGRILSLEFEDAEKFAGDVREFYERLKPSPIRRDSTKDKNDLELNLGLYRYGKRDVILDAVRSISLKTGLSPDTTVKIDEKIPFRDVFIDESCTICDACKGICKTEALRKDMDRINFAYGYCIACGLCEEICPEDAIKLSSVLDFAKLLDLEGESESLVESEMVECKKCGRPYITRSALDRMSDIIGETGGGEFSVEGHLDLLGYCEDCRPLIALKKMKEET
ncbi:MAG: 4Fe-4S binding protein [Halobacteriota archaeon]|nr:4Fe-4S binding protein [Halobacteriota archaeon]